MRHARDDVKLRTSTVQRKVHDDLYIWLNMLQTKMEVQSAMNKKSDKSALLRRINFDYMTTSAASDEKTPMHGATMRPVSTKKMNMETNPTISLSTSALEKLQHKSEKTVKYY